MPGRQHGTPRQGQVLAVQVQGLDPQAWAQFRARFLAEVVRLIDELGVESQNQYFAERAAQVTPRMLVEVVNRLATTPSPAAQQSFENVRKAFESRPRPTAPQKRQTKAEQQEQQRRDALAKLKSWLQWTRAVVSQAGDEVSVLIGNDLDALIHLVNEELNPAT